MDSFNIGNKSGTKGKYKSKYSQIDFSQNLYTKTEKLSFTSI